MRNQTAIFILSLSLGVAVFIAFITVDKTRTNWIESFLGISGSLASLVGIVYTIYQLFHLKMEADTIKTTSVETKQKLLTLQRSGDLAHGIKLIQEIQGHIRQSKHELAIARIQELKISIGEIKATLTSHCDENAMNDHLQNLNLLISSLEKDIEQKQNSIEIAKTNGDLEKVMDLYVAIKTKIFAQS